ncbi:unnamed protein product [Rangifer tarandus platyrhynchus]|uniref:Uncharacterized protein n=1 Tax=Rangifer tarandus platyrhynchus TaxID=3082113 RepID=A0AC60A348_RANTA
MEREPPAPPGREQRIRPQVGRMCAVGVRFVIRPYPSRCGSELNSKNKTKTNRNLAVVSEDWGFHRGRGVRVSVKAVPAPARLSASDPVVTAGLPRCLSIPAAGPVQSGRHRLLLVQAECRQESSSMGTQ